VSGGQTDAHGVLTRRVSAGLISLCALFAALASTPAHAEVLHLSGGHFAGVAPRHGVANGALPGAVAQTSRLSATTSGRLVYYGGPVAHASAPYLIFWTPSGQSLPTGTQSLLTRYFTDVAADSGTGANVYGVTRQYFDNSGIADYRQSFSASGQAITDTGTYPHNGCSSTSTTYATCLTDTQLQAEIQREITALHLPTDGAANSELLPATAPIYIVVLPTDVNVCASWGCANSSSSGFCAYHSSFHFATSPTASANNVLYATVPTLIVGPGQNAKVCQFDGNSAVQEPNASAADVALKYLSHEDSETITDPFGDAWWDPSSGNEDGDNCNAYGLANPGAGTSPNAFAPVLGGSKTGSAFGSLYDEVIAGDPYYLQSEWSNGTGGCDLRPSAGSVSPAFSSPAATTPPQTPLSFDPAGTTATYGLSSATWNFGDGTPAVFNTQSQALTPVAHTYRLDGTYTATLTAVDNRGNLASAAHVVHVDDAPVARFQMSLPDPKQSMPGAGQPNAFDALASSDPDGTITAYAWDFGDNQKTTGPTPIHTYQTSGSYIVTLTVTDTDGQSATTTQTLSVAGPTPTFSVSPSSPLEGAPVSFDGSASSDTQGSAIKSYSWNFSDDGSTQSGSLTATHTFTHFASAYVTLTLTDASGFTSSYSQKLTIADELPTASYTVPTPQPGSGQPVAFDASASSDPDGTISAYAWDFGDGTIATGPSPTHVFASPGSHSVTLTVTDSDGSSAICTQTIAVAGPIAAFTAPVAQLEGTPLDFSAGAPGPQATNPVTYAWSFGDGATASGASATHAYLRPGKYTATLTVTDASGYFASVAYPVSVLDAPPVAAFGVLTTTPSTQRAVAFDASASTDSDGAIAGYAWQFGDGSLATGQSPTHLYATPGTYSVTLTVTDSSGQASPPVSHQVMVYGSPQAAFAIAGNGAPEGGAVGFNAGASGDAGAGGPITSYAWTFGDGSSAKGMTALHGFARAGAYPVTLTVTNAVGLSDSVTEFVTIGDEAPTVLASILSRHPVSGQPVGFDGAASHDPDEQIVSYDWSFDDGESSASSRPSHVFRSPGRYTVTLTVTAGGGERATRVLSVLVLAPARITRVRMGHSAGGPALVIDVNGPGRLRMGHHNVLMRAGGATRIGLRLSPNQLHALAVHHTVRLRAAIEFTPLVGAASHQIVTVSVRKPTHARRYTFALR
jgi:PKD repeat protein